MKVWDEILLGIFFFLSLIEMSREKKKIRKLIIILLTKNDCGFDTACDGAMAAAAAAAAAAAFSLQVFSAESSRGGGGGGFGKVGAEQLAIRKRSCVKLRVVSSCSRSAFSPQIYPQPPPPPSLSFNR